MNTWKPWQQTDIRESILRNVPENQKSHPVFKRMSEQFKAGTNMPTPALVIVHKSPEKMQ